VRGVSIDDSYFYHKNTEYAEAVVQRFVDHDPQRLSAKRLT